jgi:O-antigen ligase
MTLTGLAFLAWFAFIGALSVVKHPIFGVMAYVMLVFLDPSSRWWGAGLPDLRWSVLAILLTVAGLLIHRPAAPAIPAWKHAPVVVLTTLLIWGLIQCLWVPDLETQTVFLNYLWKYAVALYLLYRCVDTERHFRWLLWTIVAGCTYLAWVAHSEYTGGRFDSFGGSGIGEANAGALTMVCGFFIAASLFLASDRIGKLAALLVAPVLLNALVMTISRSGFLALVVGGLTFVLLSPKGVRIRVITLAALAVPVFLALSPPEYWSRVETVKYRGEEVQGLDTGTDRVATMDAQLRIFRTHPLGCGSDCTTRLSASYLDERFLNAEYGARSSHNTFLSWLVDFGVIGGVLYLTLAVWAVVRLRGLLSRNAGLPPGFRLIVPGIAACVGAQLAADQFVPYMRFEVRYWILGVIMLLAAISSRPMPSLADTARDDGVSRRETFQRVAKGFARQAGESHWRFAAILCAVVLLILTFSPTSHASDVATHCKRPAQADRFDYTDPETAYRLEVVERHHFNQDVQQLVRGQTGVTAAGDLAFVLRYIPNHYPALALMAQWQLKNSRLLAAPPPGSELLLVESADCYFLRAIEFRPEESRIHLYYGTYLHRANKFKQAEIEYMKAEMLGGPDAELYYNLGLLMLDLGDVERAGGYAEKAYSMGYPLPGLRDRLQKQGKR